MSTKSSTSFSLDCEFFVPLSPSSCPDCHPSSLSLFSPFDLPSQAILNLPNFHLPLSSHYPSGWGRGKRNTNSFFLSPLLPLFAYISCGRQPLSRLQWKPFQALFFPLLGRGKAKFSRPVASSLSILNAVESGTALLTHSSNFCDWV